MALGLALHGPWQDERHSGGPQLLVASAAAAQLARPADDPDIIQASAPVDPLPVTRLTARGGAPIPASAEVERVSTDAVQADVTTVGDFKTDDAPAAPARAAGYTQASYAPTGDER